MDRLALVVPCYNEEAVLEISAKELKRVLSDLISKNKIAKDSFVLFVNDGSKDRTWELIEKECGESPMICGLKLAGNVGHQFALTAGLLAAKDMSDVTISIDADLQDDTAVIEEMIDKFHEGKDIVYGVRNDRKHDSFFKRTTAQRFYKYEETNLFLRGMMPLIGYETDNVYYERKERVAGESKYPLKKMLALAWNGITSFSVKPISLITALGFVIMILSIFAAVYAFASYFLGTVEPGWTSLILSIWFLGGLQLIAIGLIGQYIGKIYIEVKHRPRYNVEKLLTHDEKQPDHDGEQSENQ